MFRHLLASLGVWLCLVAVAARADAGTPQWRIVYGAPISSDAAIAKARDILAKHASLEELQNFLRPLRLPADVIIRADECGAPRRAYAPDTKTVTICYETVANILKIAAERTEASDRERRDAIVGAIVQALLHETAYALFDVFHVPVWGRIEDAADRLSALVMMQFGDDNARIAILGATRFFQWSSRTWTGGDFASSASPEGQRFYDFLCIAVGGDYLDFGQLAEDGVLPPGRAPRCAHEYEQVRKAFNLRLMPYIDPDLLVKARARAW